MKGQAEFEAADKMKYTAERSMMIDGHEVAWMLYEGDDIYDKPFSGHQLMCECDFVFELTDQGSILKTGDSRDCPFPDAAKLLRYREVRAELDADPELGDRMIASGGAFLRPKKMEKMVLSLVERAQKEEWIGQREGSSLYSTDLAEILKVDIRTINEVLAKLHEQKLVSTYGAHVGPYKPEAEPQPPRDDDDKKLDDAAPPEGKTLSGVLNFHSETGTEGGYWAFQDSESIKWEPPSYGVFPKTKVKLASEPAKGIGVTTTVTRENGEDLEGGLSAGEVVIAGVLWPDGSASEQRSDELLTESWSYEGLHLLKTGDWLEIDPETALWPRWSGYVRLRHYDLFTEDAGGMWIHADQRGVDRELWAGWFFKGLPAKLVVGA